MPITTPTFRLFVSSTFEDLKGEREALQRRVFPRVRSVCQHGAEFQAINMRWGVRDEAGLDHRTMEICLSEIARCQQTGLKPNFIVVLGDRYGWVPLPARIPNHEFEALLACMAADDRRFLLPGWYRLDSNAVPAEYVLQPRGERYAHPSQWDPVESRVRKILQAAARTAGLGKSELLKYSASATHQEIVAGTGDPDTREHIFAFVRNPDSPKEPRLRTLIDSLQETLPRENVASFRQGDLDTFCDQVAGALERVVLSQTSRFQTVTSLQHETRRISPLRRSGPGALSAVRRRSRQYARICRQRARGPSCCTDPSAMARVPGQDQRKRNRPIG